MKIRLYVLIAVLVSALCACSDSPATEPEQDNNPAEQPGGSQDEDSGEEQERKVYFTNPVINSDVPDICITRAGEDYYMVSTTMYFMPGAPIMHSKDLVSWKIIGYVFDSLDESAANNLEQNGNGESDIYAKGQWASSIRYHDGWFYVMFATGFGRFNHTYIYKTQDPAGKWQLAQKFDEILHDSSLFFEDDGTPFIITFDGEIIELDKDLAIKTRNFGKLNMNIEQGVQCEGCQFFKVMDENQLEYVLLVRGGGDDTFMIGKMVVFQIQNLLVAYKERFDKDNFIKNLLLDNLLLVDIYNRAQKLHIEVECPRIVYLIETRIEKDNSATELLKSLFSAQNGDYITAVDERNIILIKALERADDMETIEKTADMIVDMMNSEAMMNVRVAYGTVVGELREVSKSYKEAKMALDVGKIFYAEKNVIAYARLGIGRLIYQLPVNLCKIFIDEIFGDNVPYDMEEETLTTINKFFENNLNVSETSRQLFIHRNTLVYRIEKLQKSTGLDIRVFDDALTFKIALMVVSYMKYLESVDY